MKLFITTIVLNLACHANAAVPIRLERNEDYLATPESIKNAISFTQSKYNPDSFFAESISLTNHMDAQYYGNNAFN